MKHVKQKRPCFGRDQGQACPSLPRHRRRARQHHNINLRRNPPLSESDRGKLSPQIDFMFLSRTPSMSRQARPVRPCAPCPLARARLRPPAPVRRQPARPWLLAARRPRPPARPAPVRPRSPAPARARPRPFAASPPARGRSPPAARARSPPANPSFARQRARSAPAVWEHRLVQCYA